MKITLELAKAMVPVYLIITFLKYTVVFELISRWCEGFMGYLGLPGTASVPLVIGNALNLYPAIGAMGALSLSGKQVTIIAMMLLFSHSLFVELAVSHKAGVKIMPILVMRIGLAVAAGLLLNLVL